MATSRRKKPSVSVLEYGRIEDTVGARVAGGECDVEAAEIAAVADVELDTVFEAMSHLAQTHEKVEEVGVGRWRVTLGE